MPYKTDDDKKSIIQAWKDYNICDALFNIASAWDNIKPENHQKAWRKLMPGKETKAAEDMLKRFLQGQRNTEQISEEDFREWIDADKTLTAYEVKDDYQILDDVLHPENTLPDETDEAESPSPNTSPTQSPPHRHYFQQLFQSLPPPPPSPSPFPHLSPLLSQHQPLPILPPPPLPMPLASELPIAKKCNKTNKHKQTNNIIIINLDHSFPQTKIINKDCPSQDGNSRCLMSSVTKKLYTNINKPVPFEIHMQRRPPGVKFNIRATLIFSAQEFIRLNVNRCPNHAAPTDATNHDFPYPEHVVRTDHPGATYDKHPSGRLSVLVPLDDLQDGMDFTPILLRFMCLGSCVGGIMRRPIAIILGLEDMRSESHLVVSGVQI
ncbi:unnamed protein product, partial [Meganyctiphanes norvegica]